MNQVLVLFTIFAFTLVTVIGCTAIENRELNAQVCSSKWYALVEKQVLTGDGHGHGPDIGSKEWRSVVEFKLGIRGDKNTPPLESIQWCEYINDNYIGLTS